MYILAQYYIAGDCETEEED